MVNPETGQASRGAAEADLLPAGRKPAMRILKRNAGWCWFHDGRAIVVGDLLVFGSVASGQRGGSAGGDIEVTALNLEDGTLSSFTLHKRLQEDDHNAPGLIALQDGRILAAYQSHHAGVAGADLIRFRTTCKPGEISRWSDERQVSVGAGATYSNLFRDQRGRILDFHRGKGFNTNVLISEDDGQTFRHGGRLLKWPRPTKDPRYRGVDGGRPYPKFAADQDGAIHFVTTEDHPRAYLNSIYHGVIRDGAICRTDGSVVADVLEGGSGVSPAALTCVFRGDEGRIPWTMDIKCDPSGRPIVLFSVQVGGGKAEKGSDTGKDHRYYYGRWSGSEWLVHELCHAGSRLYSHQPHYTGLACLDPTRPNHVYLSTNADPVTAEPLVSSADGLRHYELFQAITDDDGANRRCYQITKDSVADNIRPVVPGWRSDATALIWLRGRYTTYSRYDLDAVGTLFDAGSSPAPVDVPDEIAASDVSESFSLPARHLASKRKPRVACIMMQKNEDDLLEPWIAYHGRIFGFENLFVFDNSSTNPRTREILQQYGNRINVIMDRTRQVDFELKGGIFGALIRYLEKRSSVDCFLPLDCDEFIALEAPDGGISCTPESILEYLGRLTKDLRVLRIKRAYFNDPRRPLHFFSGPTRKCYFARGSFLNMDIGFHWGKSRHSDEEYVTDLVHLHFRNKPFEAFLAHAKQKLKNRIRDFSPEALAGYRGPGMHMCRYLLMTEEEYLRSFEGHRSLRLPGFEAAMKELGLAVPFSTPVRSVTESGTS